MLSNFLKNISILKKFLFINLLVFIIFGTLTAVYLKGIQPNLINKKTSNHIKIINNTIDHIKRLKIKFNKDDVRKFLFSTRFLFQNLDRVMIFNNNFELIGDTDTLDLDPRSFSQRLNIIEMDIEDENKILEKKEIVKQKKNQSKTLSEIIVDYSKSSNIGTPFSFTEENYEQFLLITIKSVNDGEKNIGYLVISEKANDIRNAINERKVFVFRTALLVVLVILIFSLVLNRYFLKPIKTLVNFTRSIKEKNKETTNIQVVKNRDDEIGILSNSLDEMTNELNKRISAAENFSTDLVHEIRNPLASLKSASEIISETTDKAQREKLVKILLHDVSRIERLITDYSQMLKDEASLSREKMKILDIKSLVENVVDEFKSNGSVTEKKIKFKVTRQKPNGHELKLKGIGNRLEQVLANLLDNAISFSPENSEILIDINASNDEILIKIKDNGPGFKESDTEKIFRRFYSNRPEKFGEHSGLGLNIVKSIVEMHGGTVKASNRIDGKNGAEIEIQLPKKHN